VSLTGAGALCLACHANVLLPPVLFSALELLLVALLGRFVECAFYVDHAPYVAPMAWTMLPLCCSMVASMALWWLHRTERVGLPIPKEDCNFLMLHGTCLELDCISVEVTAL
jgi:hypothetical protein